MAMSPIHTMQVVAFHAIYKRFRKAEKPRSKDEDFAEAICMTSDDAMGNADPALIAEWLRKYSGKKHRAKNLKKELTTDVEGVKV